MPTTFSQCRRFLQGLACCALFIVCACQHVIAKDLFRFSGFGTIGAVVTDDDEFGFQRNLNREQTAWGSDVDFGVLSALGLQLNTQFDSSLNFVGQWLVRPGMDSSFDSATRIFALVYEPSAQWQFRLGRVVPSVYLISDASRIGFAHLQTMPVQEFYGPIPIEYIDGIEANHYRSIGDGYLSARLSYGVVDTDQVDDFGNRSVVEINSFHSFSLQYEWGNWLVRAAYSVGTFGKFEQLIDGLGAFAMIAPEAWPDAGRYANLLDGEGTDSSYTTAALSYDNGLWNVKSELFALKADKPIVPHINGAYLLAGRRFGDFTPYGIISQVNYLDDLIVPSGPIPQLPFPGLGPEQLQYLQFGALYALNEAYDQKGVSLGLRWDIRADKAIKIQLDHKSVEDQGWGLWQRSRTQDFSADEVNVLSFTYEFVF